MKIILNGEEKIFDNPLKIEELLASYNLSSKNAVVEKNGIILDSGEFGNTELSDGDKIELIRFVGGG